MIHEHLKLNDFPDCVGIVGSRSFREDEKGETAIYTAIKRLVSKLDKKTLIVSGGGRGVDTYAEDIAHVRGNPKIIFRPDENVPSPARFHMRNRQIAQCVKERGGLIVAFMDHEDCRGTMSTIRAAEKLDVPVIRLYFKKNGSFLRMEAPEEFVL